MVQLLPVTCAALGLLHPQLMSPFDCSDSCRTVRGPQEPAWSRGFYARVCDVSLTLCVCSCFVPGGHGTGRLCRDVYRNTIMCTCALWRLPHMATARKVLPLWRFRGRDPAAGACPKVLCQWGSIPLSCLEDLSSDGDGFDPPPVQSKQMSFMPVDRDGQRGERWHDMVYIHTAQGGWRF